MCQFEFYGVSIKIQSEWSELLDLISKDFSYFKVTNTHEDCVIDIQIKCLRGPYKLDVAFLNLKKIYTSKNSVTYEKNNIRYNDYYGEVLTSIDYSNESCELRSMDLDRAHEVLYLLILSRLGKKLDISKIHKLHAFAISYKGKVFVCMMPSKGGKSTLLSQLLCFEGVKMISDDIPLFTDKGEILPFPIKIGLVENAGVPFDIECEKSNVYFMNRKFYGRKKLICIDGIRSKIETRAYNFDKVIVSYGVRSMKKQSSGLIEVNTVIIFLQFFYHGIIGVGLPMILEYFWELGIKDFFVKFNIFTNRFFVFLSLSLSAKKYRLNMDDNPEKTARYIIDFLDNIE